VALINSQASAVFVQRGTATILSSGSSQVDGLADLSGTRAAALSQTSAWARRARRLDRHRDPDTKSRFPLPEPLAALGDLA